MDTHPNTTIPFAARNFVDRQSDLQWDALVLGVIPEALRVNEAKLFRTKFWDYRLLHPGRATTLFAWAYSIAYQRFQARRTGLSSKEFAALNNREWNPFAEAPVRARGFWKARQLCDEMGIPYDDYCDCFFSVADDYYEQAPRPQEMYRADTARQVIEWWEDRKTHGAITYPRNPFYLLDENWINHPHQQEWEDYSCDYMRHKAPEVRRMALDHRRKFFRSEVRADLLGA